MESRMKTIIFGVLVSLAVLCLSEIEAKELSRRIGSDELEAVSLEDSFVAADQCTCENGFCEKDSRGRVVCQCFPEWGLHLGGVKCTKCNCGKDANCTFARGMFGNILKACVCPKGSYLDKNLVQTCKSCECGKDFDCKFSMFGSKTCLCDTGYSQKGKVCVGACSSNPCMNEGKCIVKGNDIVCQCVAPYIGVLCEEKAVNPKETTMINIGSTAYPQSSTLKEFPSTPEPNPSTLAPSTETEKMTAPASTESSTVNTRGTTTSPTLELIKSLVVKVLIYKKIV